MDKKQLRRDKDLDNFKKWREYGRKEDFQTLYKDFGGLINYSSQKASRGSNLPSGVFKLEAAKQFHSSLNTFDPSKGASLTTHIMQGISQKLKRLNYQYGNFARITERGEGKLGVYDIGKLQNTTELLRQQLNREPTAIEVSRELGVTPDQVEGLKQEIRKDLSINADLENLLTTDEDAQDKDVLNMVYYDMNPQQQVFYDLLSGSHGKSPILKSSGVVDFKAIAKKMNIPLSKTQTLRDQIKKLIQKMGI